MNNLKRFKNIHKNKIAITFGTGRSLEQFTMDNFLKYRKFEQLKVWLQFDFQ